MNEPDKWGAVCTQMKVGDRETERRICILGKDKGLVESQCQCHVCQHCHDPITPSSMPPAPTLVTIHVTQILIQICAQHKYKYKYKYCHNPIPQSSATCHDLHNANALLWHWTYTVLAQIKKVNDPVPKYQQIQK